MYELLVVRTYLTLTYLQISHGCFSYLNGFYKPSVGCCLVIQLLLTTTQNENKIDFVVSLHSKIKKS